MGWHGGASVGRWGLGWLQPVESDNIAFLLMPHCRPSPRIRGGGYYFSPCGDRETNVSLLSSDLLNRFYARRSLHFYRWNECSRFCGEFHRRLFSQILFPRHRCPLERGRTALKQFFFFSSSSSSFSSSCLLLAQIRHRCRYESGVPCVIHKT